MAGIVIVPWNSLACCSLARGCHTGAVCIDAVLKIVRHEKPRQKSFSSESGGWRKEGESLLSDSDGDDIQFCNDKSRESFSIRGPATFSDIFFSIVQRRVAGDFANMGELPGPPLHSKTISGRIAMAGVFMTQYGCFGHEHKTFLPWRSVISLSHNFNRSRITNFNRSRIIIQNISRRPLVLNGISYEAYEVMKNAFSAATSDKSAYTTPKNSSAEESAEWGSSSWSCSQKTTTFMPWSSLYGFEIVDNMGFGKLFFISEIGDRYKAVRALSSTVRRVYERLRDLKYSDPTDAMVFNKSADQRKCCIVTDESITLSLNKGRLIKQIDLKRVLGARRSRKCHKEIEIAIIWGQRNKMEIIKVPVADDENARRIAEDIHQRATFCRSATYRNYASEISVWCNDTFNIKDTKESFVPETLHHSYTR